MHMYNQPFSVLNDNERSAGDASNARPAGVFAAFLCCFTLVGLRVCYVQTMIGDRFLGYWDQLEIVEEPIPARNGRILSRDGIVLAYDQTQYDLALDYRWLESPPDPQWITRQALGRLPSRDRGHPGKRRASEQTVLQERQQLWDNLATATGISPVHLRRSARQIQDRVEAMVASVEQRRDARQLTENVAFEWSWNISQMLETIKRELASTPQRFDDSPLILREELEAHTLLEGVPFETIAVISSQPTKFPGVRVIDRTQRVYPLQDVAPHIIGFRRHRRGDKAHPSDRRDAESGIELAYDHALSSRAGNRVRKLNRRGETVATHTETLPRDGQDVTLTIDSRLQGAAESLLDDVLERAQDDPNAAPVPPGGCLLVMDIWSGDLLAIATAPRFSLELLANPDPDQWEKLISDPRRLFFPRATRMSLPPGSVFKVITAVAGLEEGVIAPEEIMACRGYLDTPDEHRCLIFRRYGVGHGSVDLTGALCQSCNVYFYQVARRLGPEKLAEWARRFGMGQATGIDVPGEQAGLLPDPSSPPNGEHWYPGSTLQLAIGQGTLLATPLQVLRMMAAIGNNGYLVKPRVVQQIESRSEPSSRVAPAVSAVRKIPELGERTLVSVRRGLESVISHPQGTGKSARVEALAIAGKTGTAEVAGREDHAWFAGYAPAGAPRIAFVVVLEHGGSGGGAAGPLVRELMAALLEYGYLQRQRRPGDASLTGITD